MFLCLVFVIFIYFILDILILDEVIGVGDEIFCEKVLLCLESLIKKLRMVVLFFYDLNVIK